VLAQIQTRRRQGDKVLGSYLKKTGFAFEAHERIRAQNQTDAAAIKRSSSRKRDLGYGVEHWRKSIERFRDGTLVSQFAPALSS
jgi:hypothetical protein